MAKIDDLIESIKAGFQNSATALYETWIDDQTRQAAGLRRKTGDATQHKVWVLTVGEQGAPPTAVFYGHKPSDCIKKALEWRGLPTASKGKNAPPKPQPTA